MDGNSGETTAYEVYQQIKQEYADEAVNKWEGKSMDKRLLDREAYAKSAKNARETCNREMKEPVQNPVINNKRTFSSILKEMDELHTKKNTDYGNAWHEEFQEFGPICGVLRLYEKTKRLASIYKNGKALVGDESFEDTLLDIANYAVMTLEEMQTE